tara:strand:+ start:1787 stop:1966 length:180 start_codon:yes stop_codon:yes gene_type:complete
VPPLVDANSFALFLNSSLSAFLALAVADFGCDGVGGGGGGGGGGGILGAPPPHILYSPQ